MARSERRTAARMIQMTSVRRNFRLLSPQQAAPAAQHAKESSAVSVHSPPLLQSLPVAVDLHSRFGNQRELLFVCCLSQTKPRQKPRPEKARADRGAPKIFKLARVVATLISAPPSPRAQPLSHSRLTKRARDTATFAVSEQQRSFQCTKTALSLPTCQHT